MSNTGLMIPPVTMAPISQGRSQRLSLASRDSCPLRQQRSKHLRHLQPEGSFHTADGPFCLGQVFGGRRLSMSAPTGKLNFLQEAHCSTRL